MTTEESVELLGGDKGPLCLSRSHGISWMGLQLCWTNIYTVSRYWNILTRGDKNRQGDWKVRYTCTTVLLYLRIYFWIIHWSKLRKYNNERGSGLLKSIYFLGVRRGLHLGRCYTKQIYGISDSTKVGRHTLAECTTRHKKQTLCRWIY